jgi:putative redox protein
MDTPVDAGGTGTGLRPVELLLVGLAGCTGIDVESILRKKREDVRGIEVNVSGTPRLDDWPHYYERIELEYVVTGVGVKPASVERAIELSETKYCSVKGCLGPQCEVTWTYRIVEFEVSIGSAES